MVVCLIAQYLNHFEVVSGQICFFFLFFCKISHFGAWQIPRKPSLFKGLAVCIVDVFVFLPTTAVASVSTSSNDSK